LLYPRIRTRDVIREEFRSARAANDDFAARFYLNLIPQAERKEAEAQADDRSFASMAELATTHLRAGKSD
jgi:hypothetical protein